MTITAYVIPDSLHSTFEVQLPGTPCKTGLRKIFTGPSAGSWMMNAAIFDSCPEWASVKTAKLALLAANGITVTTLDTLTLVDPSAPTLP